MVLSVPEWSLVQAWTVLGTLQPEGCAALDTTGVESNLYP